MSSLRDIASHSLILAAPVVATVSATNEIGTSAPSLDNSAGALIKTEPGKPGPASRVDAGTTDLQIKVSYSAPSSDGGSPLTSLALFWDAGSAGANWSALHGDTTDFLDTSFIVSTGIVPGDFYRFKHLARNIFGDGEYSDEVTIKAAT